MSTRGWYEYHVLSTATQTRSLAFQFYKWGDGTPENALWEWQRMKGWIDQAEGRLPVEWLDDLLRAQLGDLYSQLPEQFSLAAFLFLMQRAEEELSPRRGWGYRDRPKEQRPDYRLGFAIGKAMALNRFQPRHHPDPILDEVLSFIAAGHFVRPWKHYGLAMSVLQWLQYLTQVTLEVEMGSIAGDFAQPRFVVSYVHRFFIWIDPKEPTRITRLAIELCDRQGLPLLAALADGVGKDADQAAYDLELADELREQISDLGADIYSLREADADFVQIEGQFWGDACQERPPLPDSDNNRCTGSKPTKC